MPAWKRTGSARAIIIIFSGAGVAMEKTLIWQNFKQGDRLSKLVRAILSANLLVVSNEE